MKIKNNYDAIIIGGGAAGLMCAATAGKRGRKVLVIEHNEKVGKKILISGGGRCNFTNLWVQPENFISQNEHFCKSALSRFNEQDFISLVEKYKIAYHEKTLGQLFCDGKSTEIVDLLLKECEDSGVEIKTNCKVEKLEKEELFTIKTNIGEFSCVSLIIATGGLSISKIGATDFGFRIAMQFGINIVECKPSLVPFTLNEKDLENYSGLAGVSVDSIVTCNGKTFRGNILFTHKGLSGPAILQISNYWNEGDEVKINMLPEYNLSDKIKEWKIEFPKALLMTPLSSILPKSVVNIFVHLIGFDKSLNQYNDNDIEKVCKIFQEWKIIPSGTEGFEKAEVTKGGVDTKELSSKTFESKKIKDLYFIGEIIDVTGWLGGYNFQWAWASGYCAGLYI
ncbi:MAG: NAD(P)/FAD-dependent oxidoreductase [Bacteroidetes bacterium]|nr:NAD(P)/FAD-dependent oxidoreductase [Bacteroidota bacterium]